MWRWWATAKVADWKGPTTPSSARSGNCCDVPDKAARESRLVGAGHAYAWKHRLAWRSIRSVGEGSRAGGRRRFQAQSTGFARSACESAPTLTPTMARNRHGRLGDEASVGQVGIGDAFERDVKERTSSGHEVRAAHARAA